MYSKRTMIALISAVIFVGFTAVTLLNYFYKKDEAINSLITRELPLTSDNIYSEVQRDLLVPKIVSSAMANDAFLVEWIESGEQDQETVAKFLGGLAEKYSAFTSFLVVDKTGNFYYPEGFLKKVSPSEPRDEWFYRVRAMDEEFEVNTDPAEAHNDELTIFINVRVLNDNNEFIGAVGLGITIDLLKSRLDEYRKRYGSEVYFLTKTGELILHSNDAFREKNLFDFPYFADISNDILSRDQGEFRYTGDNGEMVLQTRYVEDIDLILAVEANISNLTKSARKYLWLDLLIGLLVGACVLGLLLKTLAKHQSKMENLAWYDEMTGLMNRAAFIERYDLVSNQLTTGKNSLILVDIDKFKSINDELGHLQGDRVIQLVANVLGENIRRGDMLARWGGEEFIVLLPNAEVDFARALAERLRISIQDNEAIKSLTNRSVTASFGVVECVSQNDLFPNIALADKNLYAAKSNGRNCVV